MPCNFTENDMLFMQQRGSSAEHVAQQFAYFEKGFPYAHLQRPATIGDGILRLTPDQCDHLVASFAARTEGKKLVKFVPASGAASRMFKEVFGFLETHDATTCIKARQLLHALPDYALYSALAAAMQRDGYSLPDAIAADDYPLVFSYLLHDKGLNYGKLPKALLQFHRYEQGSRTALEEHLVEAAHYARSTDGVCRLHFTITPAHRPLFTQLLQQVQATYEERFHVKYEIVFSVQSSDTDTLAATVDHLPFRDNGGNLLFRPGGHGALIQNLNHIDADLVFVKNIDNVVPEAALADTIRYKKVLASYLLMVQEKMFCYKQIIENENDTEVLRNEIQQFVAKILWQEVGNSRVALLEMLSRPLRVCGMVKNEGAPGGGPFFVKNAAGRTSLQIVESSQMNPNDPQQQAMAQQATHFNPVDMVCAFRNEKGEKYDLTRFVDPNTGFISTKSYEGRTLQALELPGLWNGAMAEWITLFVEVPLSTFRPVKTLFDLQKR